ncbi:hypothetical protein LCGC14_2470660, partial [marine sediment metagenome]
LLRPGDHQAHQARPPVPQYVVHGRDDVLYPTALRARLVPPLWGTRKESREAEREQGSGDAKKNTRPSSR